MEQVLKQKEAKFFLKINVLILNSCVHLLLKYIVWIHCNLDLNILHVYNKFFYKILHLVDLENVRHTPCYTSFLQRIQAKAR